MSKFFQFPKQEMSVVTSTEKGFGVLNKLEECRKGIETKKQQTNTSLG